MNVNQHRKLTGSLTHEAGIIRAKLVEELLTEDPDMDQAGLDAIEWTGQVRIFGSSVWHEFKIPGSWAGRTYYRLQAVGEGKLKSREPEPPAAPAVPVYDGNKAWRFVVESYDGAGYSPNRREWTDAQILEFVDEHHVVGRSAFLVQEP